MGLSAFERRPWQWPARDGRRTDLCGCRRRPLSRDPFPDRETALASADRRRYSRLADQLRRERAAVCRLFNGRHSDKLCVAGIRTLNHHNQDWYIQPQRSQRYAEKDRSFSAYLCGLRGWTICTNVTLSDFVAIQKKELRKLSESFSNPNYGRLTKSVGNGGALAGACRFLVACSNAYAKAIKVGSLNARPVNVIPNGAGFTTAPVGGRKLPGTTMLGEPALAGAAAARFCGKRIASKSSSVPSMPSGPLNTASRPVRVRARS